MDVHILHYGGPHGEIGASLRYLSQRYAMPYPELRAILTDVGTEELAHLEMVGTIVYQLTRNLTPEQIKAQGFDTYFVDHTTGVYPVAASGTPFSAATFSVTGDTLADLNEDLAAEQKARMTYDNILRFADDPDVRDPIKFLRAREVVHYQRFGEGLRIATDRLDSKNFYAFNPSFDK
ncbi:MAG: manganese catalase family protein [Acutalibacteraceae bacterium]